MIDDERVCCARVLTGLEEERDEGAKSLLGNSCFPERDMGVAHSDRATCGNGVNLLALRRAMYLTISQLLLLDRLTESP